MKKVVYLFSITYLCIFTFVSCGNKDYSKEEEFLKKVYLGDTYKKSDTTKIFTIVKAEKFRLYNPKLDENKKRMILFGTTSFQKYLDAFDLYDSGNISDDEFFETLKDVFTSVEPNSDGLIVKYKIRNTKGYFLDILFSNDNVYYSTLPEVGSYVSKQVYKYRVNELKEKLRDDILDLIQE